MRAEKKHLPFFRRPVGWTVLGLLLAVAALLALRLGSTQVKGAEFWGGLLCREGYETFSVILYAVRLPRVLGAMLAGVGLSLAGVLLQSITGNELAGPNIIGVNAGAGFAVMLLLWAAPHLAGLLPFAAFAGALVTTALILAVAARIRHAHATVILAGIAVTALLNAGISFIALLDSDVLASYNYFSVGGLAGVTAEKLPIPAVFIALGLVIGIYLGKRLDALSLGDSAAASLGVRVRLLRTVALLVASAAAAAVVSFAGLLGFVGIVVPHIAKRLCGGAVRTLAIVSSLLGATLVVLADMVGRCLFAPSEVPVGIIMAFIGAPFFFWLLMRRKDHAEL